MTRYTADLRPSDTIDIRLIRGDGITVTLNVEDDAGDPLDVSDRTYSASIRRTHRSTTEYEFTVDDSDAATGTIVFTLDDADSAVLPDQAIWDAEYVVGAGSPHTVLRGNVYVTGDAARA